MKQKEALKARVLSWPTPQEYNEAVQNAAVCFDDGDLKGGQPALTPMGLPRPISGAFASVYRMHCGASDWAVRCFLYNVSDQQERYALISDHLSQVKLAYTVPFKYLEEGIRLHGEWFPILKMQWADGQHLDEFVERNLLQPAVLEDYSSKWKEMMHRLKASGVAHGDLQHGNVLVDNFDFKLVDYDGMYVPALAGKVSNELGHRNYQHPARRKEDFGPYLDNFSAWVIYVSLKCVAIDPHLWTSLGGGDECLLFRQSDFLAPLDSATFATLENHESEEVRTLARTLRYLLSMPVNMVPDLDHPPPLPMHLAAFHADAFTPGARGAMLHGTVSSGSSGSPSTYPEWLASFQQAQPPGQAQPAHSPSGAQPAQKSTPSASGTKSASARATKSAALAGSWPAATGAARRGGRAQARARSWWNTEIPDWVARPLTWVLMLVVYFCFAVQKTNQSDQGAPSGTIAGSKSVDDYFRDADNYTRIADGLFEQGKYQQALASYRKAYLALKDLLKHGVQHTDKARESRMAHITCARASCLMHLGKYDKAEPLLKWSLKTDTKLFGENSRQVALDLSDLGTISFQKGDYVNSAQQFDRSLSIMRTAIKPPDEHVATVLRNRALVYQRQYEYKKAEPLLTEALDIYKKDPSDRFSEIKQLLNDLGYNYQCLGDKKGVAKIKEQLKELSAKHIDFGPYMANLQRQIKANWTPPRGRDSVRVAVDFVVHSDGTVSNIMLVPNGTALTAPGNEARNPAADNAAVKAVEDAAPFEKLPAGASKSINIRFTFDYNVYDQPKQ